MYGMTPEERFTTIENLHILIETVDRLVRHRRSSARLLSL